MSLLTKGSGVLVVGSLLLSSCERGCLSRWLEERGVGGAPPEGSGRTAPHAPRPGMAPGDPRMDLFGTDCSDGLLRCVDGRIEASRAAWLPDPCGSPGQEKGGACVCPWDPIGRCPNGCVADGLEVVATPDAGAAQLCRPDAPIARPLLPGEGGPAEICASGGYACVDRIVRHCERPGQPVRMLGLCLFGCQQGIAVESGETLNPDGLVAILCRRDDAERR